MAALALGEADRAFELWAREVRLQRYLGPMAEIGALGRLGDRAWREGRSPLVVAVTERLHVLAQAQITKPRSTVVLPEDLARQNPAQGEALVGAYALVRALPQALTLQRQRVDLARQSKDPQVLEVALVELAQIQQGAMAYGDAAATFGELVALAQGNPRLLNPDLLNLDVFASPPSPSTPPVVRDDRPVSPQTLRLRQERQWRESQVFALAQAEDWAGAISAQDDLIRFYVRAEGRQNPGAPPTEGGERLGLRIPAVLADQAQYRDYGGDRDGALATYRRAYEMAQFFGQYDVARQVLDRLIALSKEDAEGQRVVDLYRTLLKLNQVADDSYGMVAAYDQLGEFYRDYGSESGAREIFQRALAIAERLDYRVEELQDKIEVIDRPLEVQLAEVRSQVADLTLVPFQFPADNKNGQEKSQQSRAWETVESLVNPEPFVVPEELGQAVNQTLEMGTVAPGRSLREAGQQGLDAAQEVLGTTGALGTMGEAAIPQKVLTTTGGTTGINPGVNPRVNPGVITGINPGVNPGNAATTSLGPIFQIVAIPATVDVEPGDPVGEVIGTYQHIYRLAQRFDREDMQQQVMEDLIALLQPLQDDRGVIQLYDGLLALHRGNQDYEALLATHQNLAAYYQNLAARYVEDLNNLDWESFDRYPVQNHQDNVNPQDLGLVNTYDRDWTNPNPTNSNPSNLDRSNSNPSSLDRTNPNPSNSNPSNLDRSNSNPSNSNPSNLDRNRASFNPSNANAPDINPPDASRLDLRDSNAKDSSDDNSSDDDSHGDDLDPKERQNRKIRRTYLQAQGNFQEALRLARLMRYNSDRWQDQAPDLDRQIETLTTELKTLAQTLRRLPDD